MVSGTDAASSYEVETQSTHKTESFSSRTTFVISAIASVVGLGNIWRFPYLCYTFGGAAYFLPYLLCLFFLGVPLLCSEFLFGQVWQASNCQVYGKIRRRLLGVGVAQVAVSAVILSYYTLLLSWILIYCFNSFKNPQPWTPSEADAAICRAISLPDVCKTELLCQWKDGICTESFMAKANFFFSMATNEGDPWHPSNWSLWIFVCQSICWVTVFMIMAFGARIFGYMMYAVMTLPIISIGVLVGIGATLEGSSKGIARYIGSFDWTVFSRKPEIWSAAASQVFFSLGVGGGVMMTYASYNRRENPCGQDSVVVPGADLVFSFLSGFAVFGVAGFLADTAGVTIDELPLGGTGLAFKTYCVGIAQLGAPWSQIFNALFFVTLFLLGIGSASSMIEPALNMLGNSPMFTKVRRTVLAAFLCIVFWCISIIYVLDWGSTFLSEVDFYVNSVALMLAVFGTSISAAWVWNCERASEKVGWKSHGTFGTVFIGGSVVCIFSGFLIRGTMGTIIVAGGILLCFTIGLLWGAYLITEVTDDGEVLSKSTRMWWMTLGNIETTRQEFNSIVGVGHSVWTLIPVTIMWSMLLKYLLPVSVAVLIANVVTSPDMWTAGGIPVGYKIGTAVVTLFLITGPIIMCLLIPSSLDFLRPDVSVCKVVPRMDGCRKDLEMECSTRGTNTQFLTRNSNSSADSNSEGHSSEPV